MTAWRLKLGPLELTWGMTKRSSKWPSYCRMCMRRDGLDPYSAESCEKALLCEHNPFKNTLVPTGAVAPTKVETTQRKTPRIQLQAKSNKHGPW